MSANEYYEYVRAIFLAKGNPIIAEQQIAYMKHHFDFFGLKAPVWVALIKDIFVEKGILQGDDLMDFVTLCFEDDHRELHYVAIEMVQKTLKKQDESFIDFLEYMVTTKSWWDSVDWLAKLIGMHFLRFPHLIVPITERWMASEHLWLQRIAMIFQLFYKEKTDFELMKKYILRLSDSKEFFIQKGAGWALRQYSRTNPDAVQNFVAEHPELKPLTKKEAVRLILAGKV
jgi:3-methyladenine DNA glycosylase AlkD